MRRRILLAVASCAVLAATASLAQALMREVPLGEAASKASAVVVARVETLRPHWTDDHSTIVTDVSFTVLDSWRGALAPTDPFTLTVIGGEVGDLGVRSEHQPQFRHGETVVLFLEETAGARYGVYGLEQGVCRVDQDLVYPFRGEPIARTDLAATVARASRTR